MSDAITSPPPLPRTGPEPWASRLLGGAERLLMGLSSLCLVAMMLLLFADGLMRYLLNSPLSVAYDLTRMYLLPAVVFFGLSTSLRMRVHVGVGILAQRFPLGLQRCCYYLAQGIGTLFFTLVAYQVALLTHKAWVADQVLMGQHAWPLWLSYVAVPIGCGMAALRCLALPFVPAGAHADAAGLAGAPCAPTAKG